MWMWSTGINRNIVECKESRSVQIFPCGFVLIETLWNVKEEKVQETKTNRHRINRNIVECKAHFDYNVVHVTPPY